MAKRKVAFTIECDYCGKSFKTAMPFAKFCCDNHRKYFSYYKKQHEQAMKNSLIKQMGLMFDDLKKVENEKSKDAVFQKLHETEQKMAALSGVMDRLDDIVKKFIKKEILKKK